MRNIVYYVATSIDGYICGPNEDVSLFAQESDGVQKYLEDLKSFDSVLMGRNTYESGFKYGIQPGQAPYKHMNNYIISNSAHYPNLADNIHIIRPDLERINQIKNEDGTDIYMCGGGTLATWLLENKLIDRIIIKLNPIVLGSGIKLFDGLEKQFKLEYSKIEQYTKGLNFIYYDVVYS